MKVLFLIFLNARNVHGKNLRRCKACGYELGTPQYTCPQCSWTPTLEKFMDMNKSKQYNFDEHMPASAITKTVHVEPMDVQILSTLKTIKACAIIVTWIIVIPIIIYVLETFAKLLK